MRLVMSKSEPIISLLRVDSSVSATINQTRATTYMGLEAKTGRYELQTANSTKDLVRKYSTKSKPSKDDGITMLHAGKFTESFSLDVLRVNKDSISVGMDSLGNILYFNEDHELIREITQLGLKGRSKNLTEQPLMVVVNNVLFHNSYATISTSACELFYLNRNTHAFLSAGDTYSAIYTAGSNFDSVVQIDMTDTDAFLRSVADYCITDPRFISFTSYNKYVFTMNAVADSDNGWTEQHIQDYLIQYCSNFIATKALDKTSNLVNINNRGFGTSSYSGSVNTLLNPSESNLNSSGIIFNGSTYIPYGSNQSNGIITSLVEGVQVTNYRDALLSAINSIYSSSSRIPSVYLDQSVVIKPIQNVRVYHSSSDESMTSQVIGDLSEVLSIEVRAVDGASIVWKDISEVTNEEIDAGGDNICRINFKGQVSKITSGAIILVTGTLNEDEVTYTTSTVMYYIGTPDTVTYPCDQYIELVSTEDHLVNAIVPQLVCMHGEWTEELPINAIAGTDLNEVCSNVRDFTISVSNTNFSWYGYQVNGSIECISQVLNSPNIKITFNRQSTTQIASGLVHYIKIGNYTFYNYSLPSISIGTAVKVSNSQMSVDKFIEALVPVLYDYFNVALMNNGNFLFNGTYDVVYDETTNGTLEVTLLSYEQVSDAKFAVVQKFTSDAALSEFRITFDEDDNEIIYLANAYASNSFTDTISFNPDKLDGYGVNIYFDKYNSLDRDFSITLLNEDGAINEFLSPTFGNELVPKTATINDYIRALDTLRDIGFKPFFIFDGGLSNANYDKAAAVFADEVMAMSPVGIPAYTNVNGRKIPFSVDQAIAYSANLGNSTVRVKYDGWQRDVAFGDIAFECSPTYYYLQLVLSNTNAVTIEFQPIFWKTQGRIAISDPLFPTRSSDDRKLLLQANINSIIRNSKEGYSYFNANYTDQNYTSDFSEEQNVRISNKICHICDEYVDLNVISRNHSVKLRSDVTEDLTSLIDDGIMKNRQDNTATSFEVVCNDTNNPTIESREVVIDVYTRYGSSINKVKVYSRTVKLAG